METIGLKQAITNQLMFKDKQELAEALADLIITTFGLDRIDILYSTMPESSIINKILMQNQQVVEKLIKPQDI